MAKAIEDALKAMIGQLPMTPIELRDERRTLFIAIAQGVINHLVSKQAALAIAFDVGMVHVETHPVIQVKPSV
jgi:hypothetical protein